MRLWLIVIIVFFASGFAALAQEFDEIIVTGTRVQDESPGIFVEKKGDFLLLEVEIENDSRELSVRLKEMNATIKKMMSAAKNQPDIELSLVDENDFVRPLTVDTFYAGIRSGTRPDTSVATIKVKTNIPENVADSYKLAQKLAEFVDAQEEIGRTIIDNNYEMAVSVINPYQYRSEVRAQIIDEINKTVSALGGNYSVIVKGLDGPVKWTRSGDLKLAFYMDYSYEILPKSLTNYSIINP